MNNFDEVMFNVKNDNQKKPFDKNAWAEKKKQERQDVYDLIDKTANEIKTDINKYKEYLSVQGRFDKYSVGNALIITAKMPNAIQFKDYNDWKESGNPVKNFKNPIGILEPSEYTRADGSTSISYNVKRVFDISQTTYPHKNSISYDDKVKLTALLKDSPVDIKIVDDIPNSNNYAEWNKDDNVIYIKRSEDISVIFKELARELAKVSLEPTGNIELDNHKYNATAYMLCKKYDIDTTGLNIDKLPDSFKDMSTNDIRNELSSMRSTVEDINTRMSAYFETIQKAPKNKDKER